MLRALHSVMKYSTTNLNMVDTRSTGVKHDTAYGKPYHAIANRHLAFSGKRTCKSMMHTLYSAHIHTAFG